MKRYHTINNITGWVIFLIAAATYCLTVEPTASFWDCPEFISTAFKLEVGHPPGAPFFMLTGNLFSQFTDDPTQVAYMVNIMSALLSAFCILFLFWSITHLTRKLITPDGVPVTTAQVITIMASGAVGALAYTWSDTFWFSAVEGEVYAYSSMFTALVFWLILKWEEHADEPHADRWIVLIFYLMGLSIGVHLLNLLCIPAIVLVYYYKRYPDANLRGSLIALGLSIVVIAAVLYGVVPGIVKVGGWFERFAVNTLHLPFNSGVVIYLLVLVATVLSAIWATTQRDRKRITLLYTASIALLGIPFYGHGYALPLTLGIVLLCALVWLLSYKRGGEYVLRKRFLNTSLLCMLVLMIGYSSYALIVIRSTQNTPMDQNSPEDIFTLGEYLGREQYGQRPLFYGEAYTSQPTGISTETKVQRREKATANEPDQYDVLDVRGDYEFPASQKMLFPRMYSSAHAGAYNDWLGGVTLHDVDGGQMPSQWDNLRYFLSYQVNFMYWRYFMWNFAGRQNDIQGHGELEHGNWITGIGFIDTALLSDQDMLPDELKENKGHNVFYCLPLLLGLLGLFWQAYRGEKGIRQFWIVFFLFFMTGLAIVLYLNQTPLQPRERDYAYAGSFYAFAIWIGLGVAALTDLVRRYVKLGELPAAVLCALVCLLVPVQMVSQTWDDHDRSGRYACRDFGLNYLSSLDEGCNPIIFTNGDNDTFPLWYNQDVEGNRTDARVCNLSYLQTSWYTDQMRRPAYDSPSLPITWQPYEYADNKGRDIFQTVPEYQELLTELKDMLTASGSNEDPFDLEFLIKYFVRGQQHANSDIQTAIECICTNPETGQRMSIIPTDSVFVRVNKSDVIKSGMLLVGGADSIPDRLTLRIGGGKGYVTKSEMMVYELLLHHNWTRPLYMSVTLGSENSAGLDNYLVLEGLAYRVTPFANAASTIDTERMYRNVMQRFRFGGVARRGIYLDETVRRMAATHRTMLFKLAQQLYNEGKKDKALKVLLKMKQELPSYNVPYDMLSAGYNFDTNTYALPTLWHQLGKDKEAERVLLCLAKNAQQYLEWYNSLSDNQISTYGRDIYRYLTELTAAVNGLEECHSKQAKYYDTVLSTMMRSRAYGVVYQTMAAAAQGEAQEEGGETAAAASGAPASLLTATTDSAY